MINAKHAAFTAITENQEGVGIVENSMEKEYYLKHLVSVEVRDRSKSSRYFYEKGYEKDNWFNRTFKYKEGIYRNFYHPEFVCDVDKFDIAELSEEYQLIENKIYTKPSVILTFANEQEKQVYFDTLDRATEYANKIKDLVRFGPSKWI